MYPDPNVPLSGNPEKNALCCVGMAMGEKIPKNPIREHNKYWSMASTQLKTITVVKLEIFPK